MQIGGRMLKQLNSIERNYGDVVLAATMFSLAIAVHGAFAVASLQKNAEPADGVSNIAIQLDPSVTPLDFGDVDHPIPTFASHDISFAIVPEQPAASTAKPGVTTAPAESIPVAQQKAPAELKPVASAQPQDTAAKAVAVDRPSEVAEEPPISALAANQGSQPTPLGISALSDTTLSDQLESAVSTQPAISAVSR